MAYIPIRANLSTAQGKKLMQGGAIALKKSQIGDGPHEMHLTKQQVQQLYKALKGAKIKFSGAQRSFNIKHGKGFWDWVKKGAQWVYKQAKPILKKGVRTAASTVGTLAGKAAKEVVGKIPFVGSELADSAERSVKKLTDYGADKADELIGDGMRMRKVYGRGPHYPGRGLYTPGKGLYTPGKGVKMGSSIQLPPPIQAVNSYAPGY